MSLVAVSVQDLIDIDIPTCVCTIPAFVILTLHVTEP